MIFEFKEMEKLEVTTMFNNLTIFFPLLPSQSKYISEELDKSFKYLEMSNNLLAREYKGHTIYVVDVNNYYLKKIRLMPISKR